MALAILLRTDCSKQIKAESLQRCMWPSRDVMEQPHLCHHALKDHVIQFQGKEEREMQKTKTERSNNLKNWGNITWRQEQIKGEIVQNPFSNIWGRESEFKVKFLDKKT